MKKIQVIIKDQYTLELKENAQLGDIIDLTALNEVDYSPIIKNIDAQKDGIYNQKLTVEKEKFRLAHDNHVLKLKGEYDLQIQMLNKTIESIKQSQNLQLEQTIKQYQTNFDNTLSKLKFEHEKEMLKLKYDFNEENKQLKENLNNFNLILTQEKTNADLVLSKKLIEQKNKFSEEHFNELNLIKENHRKELTEKDEEINKLNFQKTVKNIKQTGENLEQWCDDEVNSYMQNGLFNCVWYKDNLVMRDDNETKGSKADFIFKVFSTNEHLPEELLTSICLEMKDENPDSINKKRNFDYFKQLDNNRKKKQCKYGLLVSNLEINNANQAPMYKVREYEDMYVVRPGYLMTFINILVSMTSKFQNIILNAKKEKMDLISSIELAEEFEKLKNTYLEKPLELLSKEIEAIKKQVLVINSSTKLIDDGCNKLITKYINEIEVKLSRFAIKKMTNKLENLA